MSTFIRHALAPLIAILLSSLVQAGNDNNSLKNLGIKSTRSDRGDIVSVELPTHAGDEHLEAVAKIVTVETIIAVECRASGRAIGWLAALPRLAEVDFPKCKDGNEVAFALKRSKALKAVCLAQSSLTNSGLEELCESHPNLRTLDISRTTITLDFAIPMLLRQKELESLNIGWLRDSDSILGQDRIDLSSLSQLPLKRLHAQGLSVDRDDVVALADRGMVEDLKIDWRDVGLTTLLYLHERCPHVQVGAPIAMAIGISYSADKEGRVIAIRSCLPDQFKRLPKSVLIQVRELGLVAANDFGFLENAPLLEVLTIQTLLAGESQLARLAHSQSITSLRISESKVDRSRVKALLSSPSLKELSFERCEIDDEGKALLAANSMRIRVRIVE
ncbi:MAG: hypothetical protein SFU86_11345 [Pirellulaceae bacterium]|nr:hypothetical protein [Pirellulaceae bacterium]